MNRPVLKSALAVLSLAAALTAGWQVHAESNRVKFPDLDKLVHYTTVKRGNATEHIMTTPEAMQAIKDLNDRAVP